MRDELVGSDLLGHMWRGALPAMEEILVDNLQYDVEDAHKVRLYVYLCEAAHVLLIT